MRVLMVDDQVLFVKSLQRVIEAIDSEITVIGPATTGQEAVEMALRMHPDLVLMDVRLPDISGVEATRRIRQHEPDIPVLILTTFDDDEAVHEALRLGAVGFLLKSISPEELVSTIRAAPNMSVVLSREIAGRLTNPEPTAPVEPGIDAALARRIETLTGREREVLDLILQGFDNRMIASKLFIADQTVRNHASQVYAKLGVESRLELMRQLRV